MKTKWVFPIYACDRLMLIKLKTLHTDFHAATKCIYDVDIEIFDKTGTLLVLRNFKKEDNIGGNAWGREIIRNIPLNTSEKNLLRGLTTRK